MNTVFSGSVSIAISLIFRPSMSPRRASRVAPRLLRRARIRIAGENRAHVAYCTLARFGIANPRQVVLEIGGEVGIAILPIEADRGLQLRVRGPGSRRSRLGAERICLAYFRHDHRRHGGSGKHEIPQGLDRLGLPM